MDKEQARFILQSFRPDGADAHNPDFAAALAVAVEDRELGDWLAGERAQDAAFAAALNGLAIPEALRENILAVLRGDSSEADRFTDLDATFIGALAALRPPEGLRDQIVNAMTVESSVTPLPERTAKSAPQRTSGWLRSAAVAAAIVLGAFVALELTSSNGENPEIANVPRGPVVVQDGAFTLTSLENQFIARVAKGPSLDLEEADLGKLAAYLEAKHGPSASARDLPRGLEGFKGIGCQLLNLGKTNASLLCFDKDGQTMHLVVVRREDLARNEKLLGVGNVKADSESCHQCPYTKVSVARWGDDKRVFFLLSKTDPDELLKLF